MLSERSITLRQSSYLKLLWLIQNESVPEKEKKKAQSLVRYLLTYETDVGQFTIRNLMKNFDKKKIILLQNIRLEGAEIPKLSSIKHKLVIDENAPVIQISWGGEEPTRIKLPIKSIQFGEDFALRLNEKIVGRYIRTKSDQWILSQNLDYRIDVNSETGIVRTFLYVDLSENVKSFKRDLPALKESGVLALNNSLDFKGEAGSCYAMVLLQKALLERATFIPGIALASSDKIVLLREVLNGKFIFIPGDKNIADFTAGIPKEELKIFVTNVQASLQKDTFAQMRENILEREILDVVTVKRLKAMLDEGHHIPLVIGMSEKGKLKPASDYAHMILLHDMKEIPEGYRLTAYDPNTGLNTLFVLNKNYRLDYPFYDKKYDYIGVIDKIVPEAVELDHSVRSRGIDLNKVRGLMQKPGSLVLEPAEITRVFP